MAAHWPYFTYRDGFLYEDKRLLSSITPSLPVPKFANRNEAEEWLLNNDVRGTIR